MPFFIIWTCFEIINVPKLELLIGWLNTYDVVSKYFISALGEMDSRESKKNCDTAA